MRVSESSMAAESSQRAASSSIPRWTYDVFLSFRGEDTRKGFTDHLHAALKQKGLIVFRDDKKLERGENIWLGLLKAIQESEYAVIVISENYASSAWCLDELTEIVKCKGEKRVKVLPIFYKVNPSDVRKQNCNFGITFAEHTANNVDDERRKMWRDALEEVCSISGWDVCGRHEFEVVEEICKRIFDGLSRQMLQINDDLVGIESRIEELMTLLHIGGDDVQFIGICGMGGIGKTTLAEVIYSKVFSRFEAHCFISNVREESQKSRGLVFLQKELISQILGEKEPKICNNFQGRSLIASKVKNKKVFIVLDDVDKENQLEELVGKHDWFGEGSRILITSRDRHLLKRHMNEIYEVAKLNDYDALQLFNLKAFKQRCYEGNYAKFSEDIVKYAGGLPLALKIFGSFLFDNTMDAWKSALERLKESLDGEVFDRLYISFEALGELTKKLFLDIACFFKGKHINNVIHRLKSLGHFPEIDIKVLEEKSLIRIEKGFFEVHDLLQEMSHQIVRREALGNLSRYSRLWRPEDIFYVINHNIGTDAIESIVLDIGLNLGSPNEVETTFEALSKMKKLRMIVIEYGDLQMLSDVDICIFVKSQMECYKDLSKFRLSNELRVMEWWNYLLESLPISFQSNNLVELIMPRSCIKLLWNARKSFGRLKHIDLSFSVNLIEIPDLSGVPNLEKLKLKYCLSLSKVHPSIVSLKKLKFLHIEGLPSYPINLSLPHSISSLSSLEILNLCYCNLSDVALPADLGCLSSLKWLDLTGNKFTTIPRSISGLSKLYSLRLSACTELQELPKLPIKLKKLLVSNVSFGFMEERR